MSSRARIWSQSGSGIDALNNYTINYSIYQYILYYVIMIILALCLSLLSNIPGFISRERSSSKLGAQAAATQQVEPLPRKPQLLEGFPGA